MCWARFLTFASSLSRCSLMSILIGLWHMLALRHWPFQVLPPVLSHHWLRYCSTLCVLHWHRVNKPCWAMLCNLAQGKPCWPQLRNHCAIALRQKRTESAVLIATARLLASSSHGSQFFAKIYWAGVKQALESALNVQMAHYLGRNQTLYPCCATRTG